MKIKLLTICSLLITMLGFCNLSYAYDWKEVSQHVTERGETGKVYWHIEKLKKNKRGNFLLWTMETFTKQTKKPDSMILYKEIDCNLRRTRSIFLEMYEKPMAKGKLVHRLDFEKMAPEMKKWQYDADGVYRVKLMLGICDNNVIE